MTAGTGSPPDPEMIKRYIDQVVATLRAREEIGAASQARNDQMLTWSIGLMGAGDLPANFRTS
jgi:hypothetical protein